MKYLIWNFVKSQVNFFCPLKFLKKIFFCYFWESLQGLLADKSLYKISN